MKIIMLGTGASTGTPQLLCNCKVCKSTDSKNHRTRFSLFLTTTTTNILIDTPFETRLQLLKNKINKIDAVWLTHPHSDHLMGIDDLRVFSFNKKNPIPFFSTKKTLETIKTRFPYLFFENEYMTRPFLEPIAIKNEPFFFKGLEIIPIFHQHGEMEVVSFRTGDFAFIADISSILNKEKNKLKGVKTLIMSCTVKNPHNKHMHFNEVIDFIKEINPNQAFLTHMNHRFEYYETLNILPKNIKPGFDGLTINIERSL